MTFFIISYLYRYAYTKDLLLDNSNSWGNALVFAAGPKVL